MATKKKEEPKKKKKLEIKIKDVKELDPSEESKVAGGFRGEASYLTSQGCGPALGGNVTATIY